MGLMLKRIDHQDTCAFDFFHFLRRNMVGVGDIGEVIDPVAKHGYLVVQYPDRLYPNAVNVKRVVINGAGLHHRDARIAAVREDIGKFPFYLFQYRRLRIDGHVRMLGEVEWPDIIQSGGMLLVLMGVNDGILPFDPFPEHLLPEVRTRVDHQTLGTYLQMHRTPQSFIPKIQRTAHLAIAADYGYALGCACP